ncbi:Speckle-type POZ protein like [Argiope bruennichi]|uniref:Speckle-type POZ protein like n=1 Tax=Argiope bruennichi TaxID=94029 RepID=A0A8T0EIQ7_ARGBR|nr:Speckle-type POZ protein like [Argiope bruennichi]
MANEDDNKAPFTFIWAIENSSTLHISDRISSPVFTVDSMEATEWHLEMEPDYETGKRFSGCILRCGSEAFPAHKSILGARSPVFSAMFTNHMMESITNYVDIPDLLPSTLSSLLSYIYTDTVPELHGDNAIHLYRAADKYELLTLRDQCSAVLKANLSVSNVCNILILAHMHHDEELIRSVHSFIFKHDDDILNSKLWKQFKIENPSLATETMEGIFYMMKRNKSK